MINVIDRRAIGGPIAMLLLVVGSILDDSPWSDGLRYAAFGYITLDLILRARAGYRRRQPYWTAESWRGFLRVCAIPVVALIIVVLMMAALESRLAIVGESRSVTRSLWAIGTLIFMFIGAGGTVIAIELLHRGEPSRPFVHPKWFPFSDKTA